MTQLPLSSIIAWYSSVNNLFVQRCTIFHWDKQTELLHHFPMFEHPTEGCQLPNASCSLTNCPPTSAQHNISTSSTRFNSCNADKEKESDTACWKWSLHIVSLLIRSFHVTLPRTACLSVDRRTDQVKSDELSKNTFVFIAMKYTLFYKNQDISAESRCSYYFGDLSLYVPNFVLKLLNRENTRWSWGWAGLRLGLFLVCS